MTRRDPLDRVWVVAAIVVVLTYTLVAWSLCDPWFPWRDRPVTACTADPR